MDRDCDAQWFDFLREDYCQGFPAYCGFQVTEVTFGKFSTALEVKAQHSQQDGFVHAGVMATMADHTAGYAAYTTVTRQERILTIEFKINYLRPALGSTVLCRAQVIKGGKTIIVAESEVFAVKDEKESLAAKATVTLMAVPARKLSR